MSRHASHPAGQGSKRCESLHAALTSTALLPSPTLLPLTAPSPPASSLLISPIALLLGSQELDTQEATGGDTGESGTTRASRAHPSSDHLDHLQMIARSDILAALAQSPSFGERLALSLGLAKLPEHFPTLVLSFLFFTAIHLVVAPYLSRKWFPVAYGEKLRSRLAKNNWAIHIVSQVHTVIVVPLALWNIYKEPSGYIDNQEKAFGWTDSAGFLHAIACGYFLWDALDAVINFIDLGFVAHGISCLTIYLLSFRPFIAYYGRRCLLWETSTFFLNIHWFLDKTGRTGTTFQLVNGIALLASFFGVRIVYGGITSYYFYHTLREVHETVPLSYTLIYGLGNLLLQSLNWFWFTKMITALRKRFQPKVEELQPLLQAPIQNGIHPN